MRQASSRSPRPCSVTEASTSPAQPPVSGPSSTTTMRFVFSTDARTVSTSNGRSVRRSITSTDTPSCSSALGRLEAVVDALHRGDERDVAALADDRRLAEPAGVAVRPRPRACRAACARRRAPGCRRGSRPSAAPSRRPASTGATIFRPGTPMNHETGICEWIAPKRPPAPTTERIDERHAHLLLRQEPVLRRLVDEAVHREREEVAEHDLEHRPQAGAPPSRTRRRSCASSEIGVSKTRSGPYFS